MKLTNLNKFCLFDRSSHRRCSIEKGVLKTFAKFTGKHLCQSLFFIKKETLAKVFSCEFCKIFKNTFFIEHLRASASDLTQKPFNSYPYFTHSFVIVCLVSFLIYTVIANVYTLVRQIPTNESGCPLNHAIIWRSLEGLIHKWWSIVQ